MNNNEDFGFGSIALSEELEISNKSNGLKTIFTNITDLESPNKTPESIINYMKLDAPKKKQEELSKDSGENSFYDTEAPLCNFGAVSKELNKFIMSINRMEH